MSPEAASRMRLLTVSNMWPGPANPVWGGFVARNVDALREAGAYVEVVANDDPRPGVLPSVIKYARLARRVRDHVKGRDYDAVIGHYLYPTAAMAHTAARLTGSKLVLVVHGTDARSVKRRDPWAAAARKALRSADLVVTVSSSLAETVRDDLCLPESTPIAIINMGIDDQVFRPDSSARRTLHLTASERVVLFVGNLVPVKGLTTLSTAFEALVRQGAADRLVIVGSGPLDRELREWSASDPSLAGRVTLTGRIEQAEVARWMGAADVLALPSENEGLGLVLLEAMACGTPCVASRVGGIPEIHDEQTGMLVIPGDPDALSAALTKVIDGGRASYHDACLARAAGHSSGAKATEVIAAIRALGPGCSA
jgi:glycosyltransferase involved in cell wall biosynthesis